MDEIKNECRKKREVKNQTVQPKQTEQVTKPMEVDTMINQGKEKGITFPGISYLH